MVFKRQRCEVQTEAERSKASTEQSASRSGIKKLGEIFNVASDSKKQRPDWRRYLHAGRNYTNNKDLSLIKTLGNCCNPLTKFNRSIQITGCDFIRTCI